MELNKTNEKQMREIKFRGKLIEEDIINNLKVGEWVEGYYMKIGNVAYIIPFGIPNDYEEIVWGEFKTVDEDTIVQFTGLKDKNGKEIYEGDIVKAYYESKYETGEVYWHKESASFDVRGMTWYSCENLECCEKYYEIIGNIHQNPELLESNSCKKNNKKQADTEAVNIDVIKEDI